MNTALRMLHAEFTTAALASVPASDHVPSALGKPVLKASLVSGVYQYLLEAILSGSLAAGSEVNEVTLAKRLQVSRTPVHEALRRLTSDGLIESLPSGKSRIVRFNRESVEALYEIRKILEGAATELAARHIAPDRLANLRREADQLAASPTDAQWPVRAISFDLHFHDVIAESSGNEFLRKDILRHRRLVQGFCRLTGSAENLRAAFEEHLRILDALEAHDGVAAREAMVAHIDARVKKLLPLISEAKETAEIATFNAAPRFSNPFSL